MTARLLQSVCALPLIGLTFFLSVSTSLSAQSEQPATTLRLTGLRVEYKENPLGIDARQPRLSWQLLSTGRGVIQSAYPATVFTKCA
jgi:alpha-L-rhamnosidase